MYSKVKIDARIVALALCITAVWGCEKETPVPYECDGLIPTYSEDVKKIMDTNCALSGCHDSNSKKSGRDYSTYEGVSADAGNDAFMGSVQHLNGYSAMPKNGDKLTEEQLKILSCWITNGMKP
ncbi:MAG: cytochrome c [Bacteroidia bacterium]|nr:cytochrome c [Bacteroidia bacterium]